MFLEKVKYTKLKKKKHYQFSAAWILEKRKIYGKLKIH
jgi:hypothetical protein